MTAINLFGKDLPVVMNFHDVVFESSKLDVRVAEDRRD